MSGILKILAFLLILEPSLAQYTANWTSIDSRPLPLWYDEAKFGIFCHWGVYSVPAFANDLGGVGNLAEWLWWDWYSNGSNIADFMKTHYRPGVKYADFAKDFTAIDFDPNAFANIIKSSGAKYIVLTTKHHEGFTLWPNEQSWSWNAVDVGPARDLVGEIRDAILKVGGVHWGTYFSLFEWFNPIYLADKASGGATTNYVDQVSYPQLIDLISNYKPDVIWSDGDWEMSYNYWRSPEFLAWLYNESPVKDTVVTNDRWGKGSTCLHGGYLTCQDHYLPNQLPTRKWEDSDTIDKRGSYGYRRTITANEVLTALEVITRLVQVISKGGNYLLNIGPDSNGRVLPVFEERLIQIGSFVNAHDEAIFATKPWIFQNDDSVNMSSPIWYTSQLRNTTGFDPYRLYNPQQQQNTIVYAFVLSWPDDNKVNLTKVIPTSSTVVNLFGSNNQFIPLKYTQQSGGIQVDISGLSLTKFPSTDVFVLKIEYAADQNVNPVG